MMREAINFMDRDLITIAITIRNRGDFDDFDAIRSARTRLKFNEFRLRISCTDTTSAAARSRSSITTLRSPMAS